MVKDLDPQFDLLHVSVGQTVQELEVHQVWHYICVDIQGWTKIFAHL